MEIFSQLVIGSLVGAKGLKLTGINLFGDLFYIRLAILNRPATKVRQIYVGSMTTVLILCGEADEGKDDHQLIVPITMISSLICNRVQLLLLLIK